ncbi:MAG: DEP domain-containing protein [Gloeomargarita sp. DG02_3_bins_56]
MALAQTLRDGVEVQDRRYQFQTYPQSFVGSEAVEWLMRTQGLSRKPAVQVGQELLELGLIAHSTGEHPFRDGNYFYRFAQTD